jgi:hypothetical protein
MSGTVDVGDAVQLTFNTTTGADVIRWWFDPDGVAVIDAATVGESPAGSGKFPATFAPTEPGPWRARFAASGTATAVEDYWINARDMSTEPPPLATVGDIGELFGTMTAEQESLATALIRHASRLIRGRYPDLDDRLAAGDLDPANVSLAVTQMVMRVRYLRNPGNLRSVTVGPFTRTFFDSGAATGALSLTDAETALLAPATAGSAAGIAATIMCTPGLAPPPVAGRGYW